MKKYRGQHQETGHGRAEPRDERTSQASHQGWLGVRPHGGAGAHGRRSTTSASVFAKWLSFEVDCSKLVKVPKKTAT